MGHNWAMRQYDTDICRTQETPVTPPPLGLPMLGRLGGPLGRKGGDLYHI